MKAATFISWPVEWAIQSLPGLRLKQASEGGAWLVGGSAGRVSCSAPAQKAGGDSCAMGFRKSK